MLLEKLHNEAELLERIAKNDERAFAELFHGYYNRIGEVIQLLVNDADISREIVQEVFTKIWINRAALPSVKKFGAYLYILCRNHTLNHIRKMVAEHKKKEAYLREISLTEDPADEREEKDYHQLLEKAISSLPPRQQEVFVLRQQGLKNPEISQRMNLSVESVKKYQHLALKSIGRFLQMKSPIYPFLMAFLLLGI